MATEPQQKQHLLVEQSSCSRSIPQHSLDTYLDVIKDVIKDVVKDDIKDQFPAHVILMSSLNYLSLPELSTYINF